MGCKAITPHLVSLAGRLEGKPFHLIATHRQNNPRDEVIAYLKQNELPASTPNFTATKGGSHPKVKGNGYVPYYMVFDHHGDLVRHHMCGDYHGGDGLKMIEVVDELLAKTPEIYLGREPFHAYPKLAERVAARKQLAATLLELEASVDTASSDDQHAELIRIADGVVAYRDRRLARANGLLKSRPSAVMPLLDELEKDFAGTVMGKPVAERAGELRGSQELKDALAIEKTYAKTVQSLEKRKGCKPCKKRGMKTLRISCAQCRDANKAALAKARKKLAAAIEGKDDLPISETVREYLGSLGE